MMARAPGPSRRVGPHPPRLRDRDVPLRQVLRRADHLEDVRGGRLDVDQRPQLQRHAGLERLLGSLVDVRPVERQDAVLVDGVHIVLPTPGHNRDRRESMSWYGATIILRVPGKSWLLGALL